MEIIHIYITDTSRNFQIPPLTTHFHWTKFRLIRGVLTVFSQYHIRCRSIPTIKYCIFQISLLIISTIGIAGYVVINIFSISQQLTITESQFEACSIIMIDIRNLGLHKSATVYPALRESPEKNRLILQP